MKEGGRKVNVRVIDVRKTQLSFAIVRIEGGQPFKARKDRGTDCPMEPLERNAILLTP